MCDADSMLVRAAGRRVPHAPLAWLHQYVLAPLRVTTPSAAIAEAVTSYLAARGKRDRRSS